MPKKKPTKKRRPPTKSKAKRRTRAETRPDRGLVSTTLDLLRKHDRAVTVSLRDIGEHLLVHYFGDDEALAESNDPVKTKSYAALAKEAAEETEWHEEDFRRAVKLAVVARTLPEALVAQLSVTRLLRLDAIDDLSKRVAFAAEVARSDMPEADFRERILPLTGEERRGGRPVLSPASRSTASLERLLDQADDTDAFSRREIARLTPMARQNLASRLRTAITRLEEAVRLLREQL